MAFSDKARDKARQKYKSKNTKMSMDTDMNQGDREKLRENREPFTYDTGAVYTGSKIDSSVEMMAE